MASHLERIHQIKSIDLLVVENKCDIKNKKI